MRECKLIMGGLVEKKIGNSGKSGLVRTTLADGSASNTNLEWVFHYAPCKRIKESWAPQALIDFSCLVWQPENASSDSNINRPGGLVISDCAPGYKPPSSWDLEFGDSIIEINGVSTVGGFRSGSSSSSSKGAAVSRAVIEQAILLDRDWIFVKIWNARTNQVSRRAMITWKWAPPPPKSSEVSRAVDNIKDNVAGERRESIARAAREHSSGRGNSNANKNIKNSSSTSSYMGTTESRRSKLREEGKVRAENIDDFELRKSQGYSARFARFVEDDNMNNTNNTSDANSNSQPQALTKQKDVEGLQLKNGATKVREHLPIFMQVENPFEQAAAQQQQKARGNQGGAGSANQSGGANSSPNPFMDGGNGNASPNPFMNQGGHGGNASPNPFMQGGGNGNASPNPFLNQGGNQNAPSSPNPFLAGNASGNHNAGNASPNPFPAGNSNTNQGKPKQAKSSMSAKPSLAGTASNVSHNAKKRQRQSEELQQPQRTSSQSRKSNQPSATTKPRRPSQKAGTRKSNGQQARTTSTNNTATAAGPSRTHSTGAAPSRTNSTKKASTSRSSGKSGTNSGNQRRHQQSQPREPRPVQQFSHQVDGGNPFLGGGAGGGGLGGGSSSDPFAAGSPNPFLQGGGGGNSDPFGTGSPNPFLSGGGGGNGASPNPFLQGGAGSPNPFLR
jgi:hypothetical protein